MPSRFGFETHDEREKRAQDSEQAARDQRIKRWNALTAAERTVSDLLAEIIADFQSAKALQVSSEKRRDENEFTVTWTYLDAQTSKTIATFKLEAGFATPAGVLLTVDVCNSHVISANEKKSIIQAFEEKGIHAI